MARPKSQARLRLRFAQCLWYTFTRSLDYTKLSCGEQEVNRFIPYWPMDYSNRPVLSNQRHGFAMGNNKLDTKTSFHGAMADPAAFAKRVHLLWIGVETNDPERMKSGLEGLNAALDEGKVQHIFYESPGTDHEWQTWRRDLKDFAPRLFRPVGQQPARSARTLD